MPERTVPLTLALRLLRVDRRPTGLGQDRLEFLNKVPNVLEFAVHAGEPDVCDLVDRPQQFHQPPSKNAAGDFTFVTTVKFGLERRDDPLDVFLCDRPLPTGLCQSTFELVAIKGLPLTVLLL